MKWKFINKLFRIALTASSAYAMGGCGIVYCKLSYGTFPIQRVRCERKKSEVIGAEMHRLMKVYRFWGERFGKICHAKFHIHLDCAVGVGALI